MENVDLRSLTPEARAELKRVAIRRYRSGKNKSAISRELGLRRGTVTRWILAYEQTGKPNYQERQRGRLAGQGRTLTEAQEDRLQKAIIDHTPDQLKLAFALWSADAVRKLIYQYYQIDMPIRTVRSYLSRWGFTPQRPVKKAYEQQPKAVQTWLDESYPDIKQRALKEGAEIHWGDEAGVSSQEHYPRGYAPKGKTPVLTLSYSQRERVNMISSITNQGKMRFMIYEEKFTSQVFIRFMKQLTKNADKKIFLILDNLRVHHSKPVKAWLEEHNEKIQLFFLPSYSPELNPDEYLNCDLKAKIKTDKPTRKKGEMKTKMLKHLKSIQAQPERIKSYFEHLCTRQFRNPRLKNH
ncbi:IS630 family transposase, partial [Leucothrix pacifica]